MIIKLATITINTIPPAAAITFKLLVMLPILISSSPSSVLCTIVKIKHTYIYHVHCHVVAKVSGMCDRFHCCKEVQTLVKSIYGTAQM